MRHDMKSLRVALLIALGSGVAMLAHAQAPYGRYSPDPRYSDRGGYYGERGGYDRRGGGDMPYRIGFEDGQRDGQSDAWSGHSFRPTHSGNYHHADRGYRHEFGPRQWYKDTYRSGYMEGYRAGYSARGRRW